MLVLAFFVSEGEPVCEGPLILDVDDSDPPQCDGPIAGLPSVGLALYAVGFTITTGLAVVWRGVDAWKSKHA